MRPKQNLFVSTLISLVCISMTGCASFLQYSQPKTFSSANRVVEKPVVIRPALMKMDYQLSYGNNPALQRAYQQFLKTGKAANITTEGFVQFAYSTGNQPIVVASPLELTVITLQAGENVTNVSSGDPLRWSYAMAYSGQGKLRQPHITVKPSQANISTTLFITTDKRMYTLKIISKQEEHYVRDVRFWYPDEVQAFWDNANAEQSQKITNSDTVAELPNININTLNFNYDISGSWFSTVAWKPLRVFDDGTHTYIQFPPSMSNHDMPALFVMNGSNQEKELVNYRSKPPYFIVDKIFKQAVLVVGVGNGQSKITLTNNQY